MHGHLRQVNSLQKYYQNVDEDCEIIAKFLNCKLIIIFSNPSWWRRRTALEKSCTLISIVGIIAVAVLSLSLVNVLLARESKS